MWRVEGRRGRAGEGGAAGAAMSVEQTQAQLEQFKQAFFAEPTDTDTCEALLPKLKVRPLP